MHHHLAAALAATVTTPLPGFAATPAEVAQTCVAIAVASYGDSLITAKTLQAAVGTLIANPSEATLAAARTAWVQARVPYQQTEAFLLDNPLADDREGRVNSWQLDEGMIDYVGPSYGQGEENDCFMLNIVATPSFILSGKQIDATINTSAVISSTLHEAVGIEANAASGYHAIEFLL